MGNIFRKRYTDASGKVRESKAWHYQFWDKAAKKRIRGVGYTDKRATEHLLRELERERDQVDAGYLPSGAGLAKVQLTAHLETYLTHLRAQNDTAAHVALVGARCRTILAGASLDRWRDLDPLRVENFLADLRTTAREITTKAGVVKNRPPVSARTSNHYQSQFNGFVSWLAGRMKTVNPLGTLSPLNPEVDRRHVRRVLTAARFGTLIAAADSSTEIAYKLVGPDRAMLYLTAAYTGLRASELASLVPESIQLAGVTVTVTVEAGYSKRRRLDTVPIPPAVAVQFAAWLAGKAPGKRLWPGEWAAKRHAAAMLRIDLEAAGIAYSEGGRVFDFHALRHSYITYLVQSGVPLAQAQQLARHSTPTLTARHYLHLDAADLARETAKLPALLPPGDGGWNGHHERTEPGEVGQREAG